MSSLTIQAGSSSLFPAAGHHTWPWCTRRLRSFGRKSCTIDVQAHCKEDDTSWLFNWLLNSRCLLRSWDTKLFQIIRRVANAEPCISKSYAWFVLVFACHFRTRRHKTQHPRILSPCGSARKSEPHTANLTDHPILALLGNAKCIDQFQYIKPRSASRQAYTVSVTNTPAFPAFEVWLAPLPFRRSGQSRA